MEPANHENSPEFIRIAPAQVNLSTSQTTTDKSSARIAKSVIWLGGCFALLLLMALAVILVLPDFITTPEPVQPGDPPQQSANSPPTQTAATTATPAIKPSSPWQEAQLARDRKIAQDVLAELLEQQFQLDASGVQKWAAEDYANVVATAKSGDQHYRTQHFQEAAEAYRQALTAVTILLNSKQQRLADLIQQGNLALDNSDAVQAEQAFNQALLIDPDNKAAQQGLQRTKTLPDVMALIKEAVQLQDKGAIDAARERLRQALAVDPQTRQARELLATLDRQVEETQIAELMSTGYQALAAHRYQAAQSSFSKVLTRKPGYQEAREAHKQATEQLNGQRISTFIRQAESLQQQEKWQAALEQYDKALAIDATLAKVPSSRSEVLIRAKLDLALQQVNTHPERLADSSVHQSATVLLGKAQSIANPGPRLKAQMDQLQTHLKEALIPVPIVLQSDNHTDVSIHKVSHPGVFKSLNLSLKPGSYVAVGSRNGYRDVRKEFTIHPRSTNLVIQIQCTEKI